MAKILPPSFKGVDIDYLLPGQIVYASHFKTFCEDMNYLLANCKKSYICFSDDVLVTGVGVTELNQWILDISKHAVNYSFLASVSTYSASIETGYLELYFSKSDGTTTASQSINITSTGLYQFSSSLPWTNDLTTFALSLRPPQETGGQLGISHFFMYEQELTQTDLP